MVDPSQRGPLAQLRLKLNRLAYSRDYIGVAGRGATLPAASAPGFI